MSVVAHKCTAQNFSLRQQTGRCESPRSQTGGASQVPRTKNSQWTHQLIKCKVAFKVLQNVPTLQQEKLLVPPNMSPTKGGSDSYLPTVHGIWYLLRLDSYLLPRCSLNILSKANLFTLNHFLRLSVAEKDHKVIWRSANLPHLLARRPDPAFWGFQFSLHLYDKQIRWGDAAL